MNAHIRRSARSYGLPVVLLLVTWYTLLGGRSGIGQQSIFPVLDNFALLGLESARNVHQAGVSVRNRSACGNTHQTHRGVISRLTCPSSRLPLGPGFCYKNSCPVKCPSAWSPPGVSRNWGDHAAGLPPWEWRVC